MQPAQFRRRVHRTAPGEREHASRRLRDLLRSNIYWGVYSHGFLPAELDLMDTYDASRATVREALGMLRDEGAIDRQQGTGTFAISHPPPMQLREAHGVFHPEHESMLDRHRAEEIDRSWLPIPGVVAARLGVEPGLSCLRIEYTARFNEQVFGIATNYLVDPEASLVEPFALTNNWYNLLTRSGLSVGESEFIIGCTNADQRTAAILTVQPGSAIFTIEQVIRDLDGRPYNFAHISSRGDRSNFVSRARVDSTDDTVM
ncbi:MAG TPA: GntR family transcriptional regulator [Acidimicrobiales bacterium]|jgi:GntR family transcriptional regulator